MRRLVTSLNLSPTSQPRGTVSAGCSRKWSDRQSRPMARPGRRQGQIVITTIPEMKIGTETVIPATVILPDTSERRRSPHRHSSDHRRPASTSGRPSDRSWEWSSTSSTPTSTGSRHRDPSTGQQGSSRQSRAEDRACGSKAQLAASSLSKRETSSHGDLSGHPGSTQQVCDLVDVVQRSIRHLHLRPGTGH